MASNTTTRTTKAVPMEDVQGDNRWMDMVSINSLQYKRKLVNGDFSDIIYIYI